MGLEVILEEIRASGEAQIHEIERNAQAQIGEILAQARMEAQQIEEDSRESASAPAASERARILHRARLEALQIIGTVREDLVDTAIDRARERLISVRAAFSYSSVLRRLTQEAVAELASGGTEKIELVADPRDETLLQNINLELNLDLPVSHELNCWGGLVAKSEDGRVVVVNTFESRLERATVYLRHHLASLFEHEQSMVKDLVHG